MSHTVSGIGIASWKPSTDSIFVAGYRSDEAGCPRHQCGTDAAQEKVADKELRDAPAQTVGQPFDESHDRAKRSCADRLQHGFPEPPHCHHEQATARTGPATARLVKRQSSIILRRCRVPCRSRLTGEQ